MIINPKIKEALDLIQEAQILMDRACQRLCSFSEDEMGNSYGMTVELANRIKSHWHRTEARAQELERGKLLNVLRDEGGDFPHVIFKSEGTVQS